MKVGEVAQSATDRLNWVIRGSYLTSSLIISPCPGPRSAADGLACLMNEYARQFFPDRAASLRDCDRVQPPSANQFFALWRSSQHLRTHLPEARTTLLSLHFLPAPCRMFLYFSFEPKWWDGNYFTSSVPGLLLQGRIWGCQLRCNYYPKAMYGCAWCADNNHASHFKSFSPILPL